MSMWGKRIVAMVGVALVAAAVGGEAMAYPRPNWRRERFARRVHRRRDVAEQRYQQRAAAIERRYHGAGEEWRLNRAEHRYQANLAHSRQKARRYKHRRGWM
jgi:hypothetical protein